MQSITQASPRDAGKEETMARKIWAIQPNKLKRRYFETADQLAAELAASVRESGPCSLFTDCRWFTDGGIVVSPFSYVLNIARGYDGPFTERELLQALLDEGIFPNPVLGQSWVYVLSTENIGRVPPYCKGVEV